MRRPPTTLLFLALAGNVSATPDYEGFRRATSVTYESGTVVAVECRGPDQCDVVVEKDGARHVVPAEATGGLIVRPYHLALVSESRPGRFVVEVEVGCQAYADAPPAYVCLAQLTIVDQALVDTLVLKRTFIDTRDAEPLIVR